MLKLQDAFAGDSTSNQFISHHSEPINVMAVGTWGDADATVLTLQVNPDPKRESWVDLSQDGSTVTLSATNNMDALVLPGGVYCRFTSSDVANTDLNLWVGGPGVTLVSGEV